MREELLHGWHLYYNTWHHNLYDLPYLSFQQGKEIHFFYLYYNYHHLQQQQQQYYHTHLQMEKMESQRD